MLGLTLRKQMIDKRSGHLLYFVGRERFRLHQASTQKSFNPRIVRWQLRCDGVKRAFACHRRKSVERKFPPVFRHSEPFGYSKVIGCGILDDLSLINGLPAEHTEMVNRNAELRERIAVVSNDIEAVKRVLDFSLLPGRGRQNASRRLDRPLLSQRASGVPCSRAAEGVGGVTARELAVKLCEVEGRIGRTGVSSRTWCVGWNARCGRCGRRGCRGQSAAGGAGLENYLALKRAL